MSKVMASGNLDEIMGRLVCFGSLLESIQLSMDKEGSTVDALTSARDLLSCICRDFQADIDSAEEVPA